MDRNKLVGVVAHSCVVALRKESVDRNSADFVEIDDFKVALRKESVDRNFCQNSPVTGLIGRSPQGERG